MEEVKRGESKEVIDDILVQLGEERESMNIDEDLRSHLLSHFSNYQQRIIRSMLKLVRIPENTLLYDIGDPLSDFYIVLKGEVSGVSHEEKELVRSTPPTSPRRGILSPRMLSPKEAKGEEKKRERHVTHEIVGDISLLQSSFSDTKYVTKTNVEALSLNGLDFQRASLTKIDKSISLLNKIPMVKALKILDFDLLVSTFDIQYFAHDQTITNEEIYTGFFIVLDGEVNVTFADGEKIVLSKGQNFGSIEACFFREESNVVLTTSRVSSVELLVIPTHIYEELYREPKPSTFLEKSEMLGIIRQTPLFQLLQRRQHEIIIESATWEKFEKGQVIQKKDDRISNLYIITDGSVEMEDKDNVVVNLNKGGCFNESPVINYSREYLSNYKVTIHENHTKCISLPIDFLLTTLGKAGIIGEKQVLQKALQTLRIFGSFSLSESQIEELIQIVKVETYNDGDLILNEGSECNSFYVIKSGEIVTSGGEKFNELQHFGEQEIICNSRVPKSFISSSSPCTCILIPSDGFRNIILPSLFSLEDFNVEKILGFGSFAVIKKVSFKATEISTTYALKCIDKTKIPSREDMDIIIRERSVTRSLYHPFIMKCYNSFQDKRYLYLLVENIVGGDMRTLVNTKYENFQMPDRDAKFYIASLVLIFEYLREKRILYRDLKPENIMLGHDGYIKLVDFGNATKFKGKCFTLCGTSDYVSPEVWLSQGYSYGMDYWSLGVLTFELLTGKCPFELNKKGQTDQCIRIINGMYNSYDPIIFGKQSGAFILALLTVDPRRRLGCGHSGIGEIKNHPWFDDVDWNSLHNKNLDPKQIPYTPSKNYIINATALYNEEDVLQSILESEKEGVTEAEWFDGF